MLTLMAAQQAWGTWTDRYRQAAEQRLGVPADDAAAVDDPEYGAALDAGKPFIAALREAEQALATLDPECFAALQTGRLRILLERRQAARRPR